MVRGPDSPSKGCKFESQQEQWNFFFLSRVNFVCDSRPFHFHVTAVVRERPQSFCQKCRWQVTRKHACTHDPIKSEWANYFAVRAQCGSLSRNELTSNLSGNIQPQLSQLAELLWTDPGVNSGISVRKLISTLKKKKKGERIFLSLKNMGACALTMYRTGESFKSMGAWAPRMYRTGESFKSMGAWVPTAFSKGGCEKSFFENHGCQGTHDVRTVSFLTMYSEG